MDTDIHRDETRRIIACAHEVLNTLGHGLTEKPYENALVREFVLRGIPHVQQPHYPVDYKDCRVGEFIPDLVVFDRVIVDTKVVERISEQEAGQIINYLRVAGLRVGLILNFRHPRLECRRFVL